MLFAVLQCLLVRRTGRLGPAVVVHGGVNLVVTAVVLTAF
jgi:membrane protease YdiL (CAAX protease family)